MNLETAKEKAEKWLKPPFDSSTQEDVKKILSNESLLMETFSEDLAFGTGGMRGIMGSGTNRLNKYTVGRVTQGLANFLKKKYAGREIKVAVAHDVRHNSKEFSQAIADVLSANGVQVFLFDDFRPTPLLSFAVRFLNCQSGVVLTASHNPPEYNGYKVYNAEGGQIVPPDDKTIITEIEKVDFQEINFKGNSEKVELVSDELEQAYIKECHKAALFGVENREDLKVTFTPIHGTSVHLIPRTLKAAGFTTLSLVDEQLEPSGDFPTVKSPNPEEPEALAMAIENAKNTGADLLIGTDPDADRLGIGVINIDGEYTLLNGNETNTILTYFLLDRLKEKGKLSSKHFIGSTIVSSEISHVIAKYFDVQCRMALTGFKWIGKMITDAKEGEVFVSGGEESYGFMVGDFVRDKDSVSASLLFVEVAAWLKSQNKTPLEYLDEIYEKLGFFKERLLSFKKEGLEGKKEIKKLMDTLRKDPPKEIIGEPIVWIEDYQVSKKQNVLTGKISDLDFPKANVLIFRTAKNDKIAARPSGTEPKIKFYLGTSKSSKDGLTSDKEKAKLALNQIETLVRQWID